MTLNPRQSGQLVASKAKDVSVLEDGVGTLALQVNRVNHIIFENIKSGKISLSKYSDVGLRIENWDYKIDDEGIVNWIFVADVLNFCFWTPENSTKWTVNGQTGYYALCEALKRALKDGYPITDPIYYSTLTEKELTHLLRGDDEKTVAPLIPTRVKCLREAGEALITLFNGSFLTCVKQAEKSAENLLNMILENFPCFRDEADFEGERVSFYKRAQILVADLWATFKGTNYGEFNDIETLTMFADYRVPQSLIHFGVIKYSTNLNDLLKKDTILENGSREEVEIRGCSIHATELVKDKVKELLNSEGMDESLINSILIDYFLWTYRREHAESLKHIPFHKVFCQFY